MENEELIRKILILGDHKSGFIRAFASHLVPFHYEVHVFNPYLFALFNQSGEVIKKYKVPNKLFSMIPRVGYFLTLLMLKRIFKSFRIKYEICQIQYNLELYSGFIKTIKQAGKKLVVSIYGSDFYKRNSCQRKIQEKVYAEADAITFSTEETRDKFLEYYGSAYKERTRILRFGCVPLDLIDMLEREDLDESKRHLNIPIDALVVTCGYNASPRQEHLPVVTSIKKIKGKLPDKILFVFPLTYGSKQYIWDVESALKDAQIDHKIIKEYMSDEGVARLRRVTDIMINVQKSDQLSCSMQEHLYAGSVVLTGSWLPYRILHKMNAFMLQIDSIHTLGDKLLDVIRNLSLYKNKTHVNKEIIHQLGRWDINMKKWVQFFYSLISK